MSIIILKYKFDGPFESTDELEDKPSIYAILGKKEDKYYLVDVDESAKVKTRVDNHDRKDCWKKNCQDNLLFAVYYTPDLEQTQRIVIEQEIRKTYEVCCGKQ